MVPWKDESEIIYCECGCGTEIPKYDKQGRKKRFLKSK